MTVRNISERMGRLEGRMGPCPMRQREIEQNAADTVAKLKKIAEGFAEDDHSRSVDDLLNMSPAQHFAWALRFKPEDADVAKIMATHGRPYGAAA